MAIDIDGDGSLDRSEILEGLKAALPLDLAALEEAVESGVIWSKWDPDGDGHVDLHEFLAKVCTKLTAQPPEPPEPPNRPTTPNTRSSDRPTAPPPNHVAPSAYVPRMD